MVDPYQELVSLADPGPDWAVQYAEAEAEIAAYLHGLSPAIEHIGSTSVPLRGKPIIDIQVAVAPADVRQAIAALENQGYCHHGHANVPGREYLTRRVEGRPPVNIHLFAEGNSLLNDNRLVRDYLREHPDEREKYVAVKERALLQGHTDLVTYSHAKGAAVAAIREAAYHERLRREK